MTASAPIRSTACFFLAVLLLAGCITPANPATPLPPEPPPPSSSPTQAELVPASPAPTHPLPTTSPGPSPTPLPPQIETARSRYTLTATLDYAQHSLQAGEQVHYVNATGGPLSDLILLVEANHYPGAFTLDSLAWEDGSPVVDYLLDGHALSFPLPQPLAPGQVLNLALVYRLDLPAIPPPSDQRRPVPFGYTERQTNLVDWIPVVPTYRPGSGWLVREPWFYGEHQVFDAVDFEVDFQISGTPPPGLEIAASAPAEEQDGHRIYHHAAARSFALSISPSYRVASEIAAGVTVTSYFFPWDEAAGKTALHDTARALSLYSRLFGPYPHPTLSVVEADFLDGMEYDGLYFLSRGFYNLYDGTPQGYLTAIAVHETAHQWWYGLVGDDQALEPWLDEALCTYSERLFYENEEPQLLDWWWGFRVDYYDPSGWVNHPIYDYGGFLNYRNAVYLRGAQFLEALREKTGDEAFFTFLKDFTGEYAHRQATGEDFFTVLAAHSSADLQPLLDEYFDPALK